MCQRRPNVATEQPHAARWNLLRGGGWPPELHAGGVGNLSDADSQRITRSAHAPSSWQVETFGIESISFYWPLISPTTAVHSLTSAAAHTAAARCDAPAFLPGSFPPDAKTPTSTTLFLVGSVVLSFPSLLFMAFIGAAPPLRCFARGLRAVCGAATVGGAPARSPTAVPTVLPTPRPFLSGSIPLSLSRAVAPAGSPAVTPRRRLTAMAGDGDKPVGWSTVLASPPAAAAGTPPRVGARRPHPCRVGSGRGRRVGDH